MSWNNRLGLNITPSAYAFNDAELNQNIKALIAFAKTISTILGGSGIYTGGAVMIRDFGPDPGVEISESQPKTKFPPSAIILNDITDEYYAFYSSDYKDIDFQVTQSDNANVYAIIDTYDNISPNLAKTDSSDFVVVAYDDSTLPPANSILLGSGTIVDGSLTTWTPNEDIFVPLSSITYFKIKDDTENIQYIQSNETLSLIGGNGVETDKTGSLILSVSPKLRTNSGLTADTNGLEILLKEYGGLAIDINGLYVESTTTSDFTLDTDSGSIIIEDGGDFSILGTTPLVTSVVATDILRINLAKDTQVLTVGASGLELILSPTGELEVSVDGLSRTSGNFYVDGDDGSSKIVTEGDIALSILGTGALNTSVAANIITTSLAIKSGGGLTTSGGGLTLDLLAGGGLVADSGGLYIASYAINTSYGHPISGTHSVGEWFKDASGALWHCDTTGTPGAWSQITVGVSRKSSGTQYILPLAADFYGSAIPNGYMIKWVSYPDVTDTESYDNSFTWIWRRDIHDVDGADGYWISENVQRVPLYRVDERTKYVPVPNSQTLNFTTLIDDSVYTGGIHYEYGIGDFNGTTYDVSTWTISGQNPPSQGTIDSILATLTEYEALIVVAVNDYLLGFYDPNDSTQQYFHANYHATELYGPYCLNLKNKYHGYFIENIGVYARSQTGIDNFFDTTYLPEYTAPVFAIYRASFSDGNPDIRDWTALGPTLLGNVLETEDLDIVAKYSKTNPEIYLDTIFPNRYNEQYIIPTIMVGAEEKDTLTLIQGDFYESIMAYSNNFDTRDYYTVSLDSIAQVAGTGEDWVIVGTSASVTIAGVAIENAVAVDALTLIFAKEDLPVLDGNTFYDIIIKTSISIDDGVDSSSNGSPAVFDIHCVLGYIDDLSVEHIVSYVADCSSYLPKDITFTLEEFEGSSNAFDGIWKVGTRYSYALSGSDILQNYDLFYRIYFTYGASSGIYGTGAITVSDATIEIQTCERSLDNSSAAASTTFTDRGLGYNDWAVSSGDWVSTSPTDYLDLVFDLSSFAPTSATMGLASIKLDVDLGLSFFEPSPPATLDFTIDFHGLFNETITTWPGLWNYVYYRRQIQVGDNENVITLALDPDDIFVNNFKIRMYCDDAGGYDVRIKQLTPLILLEFYETYHMITEELTVADLSGNLKDNGKDVYVAYTGDYTMNIDIFPYADVRYIYDATGYSEGASWPVGEYNNIV